MMESAELVIAADGGLAHCDWLDITPDQVVGDLDSASVDSVQRAELAGANVVRFPQDKDATDLELAIGVAVDAGATSITVVAGFGGRLDHELATIGLLVSPQWDHVAITATDGQRQLWIVRDDLALSLDVGQTLSLIPWAGEVTAVTTTGLQWPLSNDVLPIGTTRGVSNVASEPSQTVSIASGTLLVVSDARPGLGD